MRPKPEIQGIANYTHTRKLYRGCGDSLACAICNKCIKYSKNRLQCKKCYPHYKLFPTHCRCGERGMDQMANFITNAMDQAMFDPNKRTQGSVQIHRDPAADIEEKLGMHLIPDG